jgi:hypothetical protein
MLVQRPARRRTNAATEGTRVAVPSTRRPSEGRRRAAAAVEPVVLAIAKPMPVRITLASVSSNEPVRRASTAAAAATHRPVTSDKPAKRRIAAEFRFTPRVSADRCTKP